MYDMIRILRVHVVHAHTPNYDKLHTHKKTPVMYVLTIHVFQFCDKNARFAERQSKLQYEQCQWTKCYKFIHHM